MNLVETLKILARRPECEHGLNGPCSVCGPSLNLQETAAWHQEIESVEDWLRTDGLSG